MNGNTQMLREHNAELSRRALKALGSATRAQVAAATGLSVVTVGGVLEELAAAGEAFEIDLAPSSGGRPARQYRFNERYALGLVLFTRETDGRDTAYARVADLYGNCVASETEELPEVSLEALDALVGRMISAFPAIRALGFGLPGIEVGGRLVGSDYPALAGVRLIDHFKEKFGLPAVFENDANAAAFGYGRRNRSEGTIVYLYFPRKYPPGAGVLIGGELLRGRNNFAGEVSYLPLGVRWGESWLYESFDAACSAVGKVALSVVSVLNPDTVVLHGEFLTAAHLSSIRESLAGALPAVAVPDLIFSDDFTRDFQDGLAARTLASLEPKRTLPF